MTETIDLLTQPVVDLIDRMGDDLSVVRAARVSVKGANVPEISSNPPFGLIKYLMAHRHGSPFEHATMTFYIKAPIFIFREIHRHRIASYNEMSGRYMELPGEFYIPDGQRPMVNVGTSARPEMAAGTDEQYEAFIQGTAAIYQAAWLTYKRHLANGIAKEMARIVLPVGIMSQMYATMNLRALMNFLSLRVDSPDSLVRSHPQYEIQQVADKMELLFEEHYPLVHAAFVMNGRVAP